MGRSFSLFLLGTLAGFAALALNFVLRLGGIAAYPPESALSGFLRVVPASVEEPMVQQFGDLAGHLGLIIATIIAAAVYGVLLLLYDRYASARAASLGISRLEGLLALGFVPWFLFGVVLFPLDGDSFFGAASPFAGGFTVFAFPFTLLLSQCTFAWAASLWYSPRLVTSAAPVPLSRQNLSRREFLEKGTIGFFAVIGIFLSLGGVEQLFSTPVQPTGGSQPVDLAGAPAIFSDPRLSAIIDSEVTPDADFYRVAIDIFDPTVDASAWSLRVDGLVDVPKSFSLQDIQALPGVSQYTTFECISNELNGNLIGNAQWGGAKISDVLASAGGVQPGANYVVFYSVDGYSVGIPLDKALEPDSLLAYSMNGQNLPVRHGYPLRGVIPGLYGMMSAKWVNRVSVISSVYEGYWQTRGWTNNAAIFTEAFIVLPSTSSASISQGRGSIIVAGYAFAGDRGVSKVEVSFDNGKTWDEAELKPPISDLTWALWAYKWTPAGPGEYQVIARATDGAGQVQTSSVEGTFPNGATGYVSRTLQVTD
ncbi:MAG: molybdopterin-dependent oxidoreductase [Nitrososphaerota archaeon]|nr:molybdopterin-dependent oxidoreductase [Nitrososphaerota archaeon]